MWRQLFLCDQLAWLNIWCRGKYSFKVKFKIPPTHRLYLNFTAACFFLIFQVDPLFRIRRGESSASRFRHTPTQMEECTQYSAASFISWTWKLAVLIDWLNICLHLWLIAFWFIDWLILHLLLHWLILHWLIDWIGIGIYWLIWIGIWWRLCTCAYPVHNSPTLGRHNWLIDWLLWGAALR